MSFCDTRPLENRANNSCNYILDNLINGLAKESNNKDSENVVDKGKAENYSDGSDDSDDIDDVDFDSSDSGKGNKARGCVGRRGLLTSITSQLRTKRAVKHHL